MAGLRGEREACAAVSVLCLVARLEVNSQAWRKGDLSRGRGRNGREGKNLELHVC